MNYEFISSWALKGMAFVLPHVCTQNGEAPVAPAWKQLVQSLEVTCPQEHILVLQMSQDALPCKQDGLGERVKTPPLLTGQILRNQQNALACSPRVEKDRYNIWLRSKKGSIKIKELRHIGAAAAIVCLSLLAVFFVHSHLHHSGRLARACNL